MKRYCNIRCKSLEDIKATCERHIRNNSLTRIDFFDNEDMTRLDEFYLDIILGMWSDMLEDVTAMLEE